MKRNRSAKQLPTPKKLSYKFLLGEEIHESLTTIMGSALQQLAFVLRRYEEEAGVVRQFDPLLCSEISQRRNGSQVELLLRIRVEACLPIPRHQPSPRSTPPVAR